MSDHELRHALEEALLAELLSVRQPGIGRRIVARLPNDYPGREELLARFTDGRVKRSAAQAQPRAILGRCYR